MAAFTAIAETAVMRIVAPVASDTVAREIGRRLCIVNVTTCATHLGVRTRQWEACEQIVIKRPGRPCRSVVAGAAAFTQRSVVRIIVDVTAAAIGPRVMEGCRLMATGTREVGVRSEQRERGNVVVEPELTVPAGRDMAGFAVIAELALVRIVVAMTTGAVDGQGIRQCTGMTAVAAE